MRTYRGGAFIGEHGSWDRSPVDGYVVSYVTFENGKPVGAPNDVVTGFASPDQNELYGASVGVAQDRDAGS
ncbi:glucose/arabinose dehydrogenase [Paraburkholderia atlantica]|nr:glucose/arabinose dehydrogenase [Paraburkholderia atlantica]